MGFKNEFADDRGPALEGLKGERWKDVRQGDFIRGRMLEASVQDGTTMKGAPEKKFVLILGDVIGKMDGVAVSAPVASLIANTGRGSALAEALDEAPAGATVQIHFVATKPGAETGTRKLWTVKVWAEGVLLSSPPNVIVDMRTWGEKKVPAWAAPSEKVAAV